MRFTAALFTLSSALTLCAPALGGGATYQSIPDAASANDMSPDGRFVVGMKTFASGGGTYLWDRQLGVMTTLPAPAYDAVAVSDDGTVIAGMMEDEDGFDVAAVWTLVSNQWTSLGYFPSGVEGCGGRSSAYDISGDGTTIVGLSWVDGCQARGFKWTQATGMVELGVVGLGGNRASVVNANGSRIGGFGRTDQNDRVPALWKGDGTQSFIASSDGGAGGEVQGMNGSGSILLGNWNNKATKWTNDGATMTTIGAGSTLPGWTGIAMDIAGNGTTVGFDISFGFRRAWIQIGGAGQLIEFRAYLNANGASVPDDVNLEVPRNITTDGKTITGHGFFTGGWIATIDPTISTCTGDISPEGGNGIVDGADLAVVLGAWGTTGADLNGDGTTDGSDLAIVLGNWGQCVSVLPGACCFGDGCAALTAEECAAANGTFLGANVPCTVAACLNNDHCSEATDITSKINGPSILADNSLATPPFGGGDTELPTGTPSCQWSGEPHAVHSTVWYKFTAPANGFVSVTLCDEQVPLATADTIIAIYGGTCGELTELWCDEDGCIGTYRSNIQFAYDFIPGETYYLMIGNPGGWTGSTPGPFSFRITSP